MPHRFGHCRQILLVAFLCILGLHTTGLRAEGAFDVKTLSGDWYTIGASREDRRQEFNKLFDGLANILEAGANVPIKVVTVAETDRDGIGAIANREGVYRGLYPDNFTKVFCLLNRDACDSEGAPKALPPGKVVVLPRLEIAEFIVHQPYQKGAAESIESIVAKRGGCVTFDDQCRKYLLNLNIFDDEAVDYDSMTLKEDYTGEIVVPTRGFSAELTLRYHTEDVAMRTFLGRNYSDEIEVQSTDWANPFTHVTEYSGPVDPKLSGATDSQSRLSKLEYALAKLEPNLLSRPENVELEAMPPGTSVALGPRKNVFELIRHPFVTGIEIPIAPEYMHVGVLDGWVDDDHCEFAPATIKDAKNDAVTSGLVTDKVCGQPAPVVSKRFDHGTHVVSIISAKEDGMEGPGANPFFNVVTNQIDGRREQLIKRASDAIKGRAASHMVVVYNLSATYSMERMADRLDLLAQEIRRKDAPLYVVSAGNQGSRLGPSGCSRWPPCLAATADNIINVAALTHDDKAPGLLEWKVTSTGETLKSNHGPYVHVGAPASRIIGAVSGHQLGEFSGTSQAAPMVTAVASMLFAKHSFRAKPAQVRDRIIISSDLFASLPPDTLLGGRLNATRALDDEFAYLKLQGRDGLVSELRGRIRGDLNVRLLDRESNTNCYIKAGGILRLHRPAIDVAATLEVLLKQSDSTVVWALNDDLQTKAKCDKLFPRGELVRRHVYVLTAEPLEFSPVTRDGTFGVPVEFDEQDMLEYVAPWRE